MAEERHTFKIFASIILRRDNKVLLMRRFNTGFDDGLYHCVGGGVDGCEPITQAMVREAREELGVKVEPANLKVVHVLHFRGPNRDYEYVNFFAEATEWEGEPQNIEPHKCDDVCWFACDALPATLMPSVKHVIESVGRGVFYSEFGWGDMSEL